MFDKYLCCNHFGFLMAAITLKGIPPTLHKQLAERALRNRRSLNQEVLATLEAAVAPSRKVDVGAMIEETRRFRESLKIWATPEEIDAFKREGRD
jgi:plasmid stability protein